MDIPITTWIWLGVGALASFLIIYTIKTGKAPARTGTAKRIDNPIGYWINLAFLVALAVISLGAAIEEVWK